MEFRELTEEEFTGAEFRCRNFLQSIEMYRRYRALGREAYLVGVVRTGDDNRGEGGGSGEGGGDDGGGRGGEVVAAGLVLAQRWRFRRKIMRVAGGWLLDYENDVERKHILRTLSRGAREFCRRRGGIALEIAPNLGRRALGASGVYGEAEAEAAGAEGFLATDVAGASSAGVFSAVRGELEGMGYKYLGEYRQVKWVYVLRLAGFLAGAEKAAEAEGAEGFLAGGFSEGALAEAEAGVLAGMRMTHRRLIRKAERNGVRVRELGEGEMKIFREVMAETGERQGFREPEMGYFSSMKEAFGGRVSFVVAEAEVEREYTPLAVAMFVNYGDELIYLYGGSVRRLQKYGGAYAIQWYGIRRALAEGKARYNFYGTRPVEGDGVYAFKQGFRGEVEELLGTFVLPIGALGKVYAGRLRAREFGEIE